ncbi:MAG TPA: hypothetical protein PLJ27_26235, partial [Polyangiaceae bacterium]|nr:hypothetical protein [Polyangiaceae bacterium]
MRFAWTLSIVIVWGCSGPAFSSSESTPAFDAGADTPIDSPTCTPITCAQLNAACGIIADGCGSTLQCGSCPPNHLCVSDGASFFCQCQPKYCAQLE